VSNQKLKITAPSQEDKELFIESCRQTVEIHRERIAILENEPEYLSRRSQIPGKQEEIRGMEAMIQKAERLDSEAGWVFAASGFTTTDWLGMPWIVDWSLVRLADKRSMENTFTSDRIFPVKFAFDFYSAQTPVGDQIVYKVGRSDQSNRVHLEGNINGIWSDVAAQLPNGVPKFGSTARCISILPTGQDEFCKSGDSGSILLLVVPKEDPVWFGLTFGSANGQGLRHGYATPIKAVFKHIEEVAGEGVKVVYPRELP
jgi:hypothetical protein